MATNTKVTKITMRNGTLQEWVIADSVASLEIGEIGFESDTYRLKIGNTENDTVGTLWKDLNYFAAGIVTVQGVDGTHENGLTVDSFGKLELDIGNLVGRVDHHDTILSYHGDSIENLYDHIEDITIELERIEEDHDESISNLIDSIKVFSDSITLNLDASVHANADSIEKLADSIETFADSISDLDSILTDSIDLLQMEKVDRSGDTMTGELVFDPYGIVGAQDGQNVYLEPTETFINTPLTCRNGLMVDGDVIETNDDYVANNDNDILDYKSLVGNDSIVGLNFTINEPVTKTLPSDGGYLFRSTSNPGRIGYRPSIPLKPAAYAASTSLLALPADSVDADDLRDILLEFFEYIIDAGIVTANDQVVYEAD